MIVSKKILGISMLFFFAVKLQAKKFHLLPELSVKNSLNAECWSPVMYTQKSKTEAVFLWQYKNVQSAKSLYNTNFWQHGFKLNIRLCKNLNLKISFL